MNASFDECQNFVLRWEGGLTDDAADSGGLTNFGVSMAYLQDLARAEPAFVRSVLGSAVVTRSTIRSLTKAQAAALFRHSFWEPPRCGELPRAVALCVYDMSVNHGRGNAGRIVQRACNAALEGLTPLAVDGAIGPLTRARLQRMETAAGIRSIAERRRLFYKAIVASKPSQKVFLRGWLNRADAMEKQALAWLEA